MALNFTAAVAKGPGWQKGQSGNPAGRKPVRDRSIADMARDYAPDAIKALVHALRTPGERVPAARELLDRGFGKPQVTIHSEQNINILHLIAAQAIGAVDANVDTPQIEAKADEQPKE